MNIIQVVFGLLLALFVPGYLVARIFFKELSELEKIALAFVLSIAIDIAVGLFLGYNKTMKDITGGITATNLWAYLGIITINLFLVYIWRNKDEAKQIWHKIRNKEDNLETIKRIMREHK